MGSVYLRQAQTERRPRPADRARGWGSDLRLRGLGSDPRLKGLGSDSRLKELGIRPRIKGLGIGLPLEPHVNRFSHWRLSRLTSSGLGHFPPQTLPPDFSPRRK